MNAMRNTIILAAVAALFLLASCGRADITSRLSDIESYIDSRPDSALAAIRQIDTTALHGIALATTSSCSPFRQVNDIRENSTFNRFYSTFHARFSPFWDLDY